MADDEGCRRLRSESTSDDTAAALPRTDMHWVEEVQPYIQTEAHSRRSLPPAIYVPDPDRGLCKL